MVNTPNWTSVDLQLGWISPSQGFWTAESTDNTQITLVAPPTGTIAKFRDTGSTNLGVGTFIFLQTVNGTNAGDVCSYSVSDGTNLGVSARLGSTIKAGAPLAIATATATTTGGYQWFQIEGAALVNTTGTVAVGDRAYYSGTTGVVSSTFSYAQQIVGMAAAGTNGAVVSGQTVYTLANGGPQIGVPDQSPANFRNLLDGGDFTVNPWQRNVAGIQTSASVLGAIASAAAYFPDRWAAYSASSGGSVNLSLIADALLPGSKQHVQVARASANSNVGAISFVQVMEPLDVYRLQGQQVVLSFYAKSGANYSGGVLTANVINGTGTTANTTLANMQAASWTNQQTTFTGTATLSSAAWTRYQFTGVVPATLTSAASAVTQLGVQLQFTPTGTASANDWVQFDFIQLEVGAIASTPERRDAQVELELCQRYAFVYAEPAASIVTMLMAPTAVSLQSGVMPLPVQMVSAPTVSVAAGSFKLVIDAQTSVAATSLAAGVGHTVTGISLTTSATATATAHSIYMQGGGGAGYILASSDY